MAEKETFANELDRLIYPFINALAKNGDNLGPDQENPEIFRWANPNVIVQKDLTTKPSVLWVDYHRIRVYERRSTTNGWTFILRPGEWISTVIESARPLIKEQEDAEILDAMKEALEKHSRFESVASVRFRS